MYGIWKATGLAVVHHDPDRVPRGNCWAPNGILNQDAGNFEDGRFNPVIPLFYHIKTDWCASKGWGRPPGASRFSREYLVRPHSFFRRQDDKLWLCTEPFKRWKRESSLKQSINKAEIAEIPAWFLVHNKSPYVRSPILILQPLSSYMKSSSDVPNISSLLREIKRKIPITNPFVGEIIKATISSCFPATCS